MLPKYEVSDNQFGFGTNRGTAVGALFLMMLCAIATIKIVLYVCVALMPRNVLTVHVYGILHYFASWRMKFLIHFGCFSLSGIQAYELWLNGKASHIFTVTRGTRQGSILSPQLFNMCIDDLLQSLQNVKKGVSIGYSNYSSFAYTYEFTVYSSTIPDLQFLIQMCADYAQKSRFNFGIKKSKCMIVGYHKFYVEPQWKLSNNIKENVSSMDILGVAFNNNLKNSTHVSNRIQKCDRSFYSLRNAGFSYPGAHSDVKSYMCQPVLLYGSDCINLSSTDIKTMDTSQGKIIKQSLGLSKHSRNTNLLQALNINKVSHTINHSTLSLWNRLFCVESPTQTLWSYLCSGHPGRESRNNSGLQLNHLFI